MRAEISLDLCVAGVIHSYQCERDLDSLGSVARGEGFLPHLLYLWAWGGRRRFLRAFPHQPDISAKCFTCFSCFICFSRFTCFSCFTCFRNTHSPQKMKHRDFPIPDSKFQTPSQQIWNLEFGIQEGRLKQGLKTFYHPVRRSSGHPS